jgi:hypothetical protein
MSEPESAMEIVPVQSRRAGFSPFGFFLVLLGVGLLLSRLSIVPYSWGDILWFALAAFGLSLVFNAAMRRKRGGVFTGSMLFFLGALVIARRWLPWEFMPFDWPANIMLLIGASFFVLWLFDPRRLGLLVPVIIFAGIGATYYLWWMDLVDGYTIRHYVRTYWPVLVILMGLGFILKRR